MFTFYINMKPLAKLVSTLLCLFFLKLNVRAQTDLPQTGKGKIIGRVVDSATGKPLDYATITLADKNTGKILNGATANVDGRFTISEVSMGTYKILVEFIGYQAFTNNELLLSKKNQTVNINTIQLKKTGQLLQTVTVTAKAPLIDNKIDKMVFNAEKDITSQGGVATDILKKIPQVSVDADGNVELAGSSSIRFLINGKPSTAFGSNIADVLQSIPSSQIKSIEVITNPGAKYDAEGLGGIINIILKQNTAKGINGNLSLTAGSRTENGSFNFNARKGNLGINAFVSGNVRLPVNTPGSSERLSTDTALKLSSKLTQDGSRKFKRQGIQTGFGLTGPIKNITILQAP
jgi:5-hydroxyisourate hydrolase-like protein (transthyretin family)